MFGEGGNIEDAKVIISAFDVLKEILDDKILYGSNSRTGYIKGLNTAVCFSDLPLSKELSDFITTDGTISKYKHRTMKKYEGYGLIFKKYEIIKRGGEPVYYLSEYSGKRIPLKKKWRHVRHEPYGNPSIDFTHEREWRVKGDFNIENIDSFYVFVKTRHEAFDIKNMLEKNTTNCAGVFTFTDISRYVCDDSCIFA